MSDISNFIRRSGNTDRDEINKLLSIMNPLVFPEAENAGLKERIIFSNGKKKRTNTSSVGTDITKTSSNPRSRYSSSITIITDSATTTAPTYTATLSGTLTFPSSKKNGAGATFTGSQYYTLTDTGDSLDLTTGSLGMLFWFKSNGTSQGEQTIYSKRLGDLIRDYSASSGDFDTNNYFTSPNPTNPGVTISLVGDTAQDHCSSCTDFDTNDFVTTTSNSGVRIIMADGSNSIDQSITSATNIFDQNWHSIVINASDIVSDYCSSCTDFDTDDFSIVASPNIEVFLDTVSLGTVSHSTITGTLGNSQSAYFGATDNGGTLENFIQGTIALWEFQSGVFSTTAITDYHSKARIRSNSQKAALHFIGNATQLDVLDNLI